MGSEGDHKISFPYPWAYHIHNPTPNLQPIPPISSVKYPFPSSWYWDNDD